MSQAGQTLGGVLFSWVFLSLGILTHEVGVCGAGMEGYWSWDPVENSSLMPWLTAAAFPHSAAMQERRGIMRSWSFPLVVLTFELTIFGTFLTRSGVVSSVHAFARSPLGYYFLAFIGLSSAAVAWIAHRRREMLGLGGRIVPALSREGPMLLGILVLCMLCSATFFGTMLPVLSVLMLLLMGVCPLTSWGRTSASTLLRRLPVPLSDFPGSAGP
ncbi:MAG TPA: hypothetical protein EYP17_01100 [Candidatus Latescibacteria bacterium]|nr:hypothetical protein [Candidatus Latescibacterota bacterium]